MINNIDCWKECEDKNDQTCWLCPQVIQTEDIFNDALMSKFWKDAIDN